MIPWFQCLVSCIVQEYGIVKDNKWQEDKAQSALDKVWDKTQPNQELLRESLWKDTKKCLDDCEINNYFPYFLWWSIDILLNFLMSSWEIRRQVSYRLHNWLQGNCSFGSLCHEGSGMKLIKYYLIMKFNNWFFWILEMSKSLKHQINDNVKIEFNNF